MLLARVLSQGQEQENRLMRKTAELGLMLLLVLATSVYANDTTSAEIDEPYYKMPLDELKKRAKAGEPEAQWILGGRYDWGWGVRRSGRKAMKYYRMAAEQGFADAQNSVGSSLQAEKKYAEALRWYQLAADQDHALALNNLAYLYDEGLGVPQDKHKGLEYYFRSAELGEVDAMWNIANVYGAGQLGEIDLATACIWTRRTRTYADPDNKQLAQYLTNAEAQLAKELSEAELATCQLEADSWAPSTQSDTGAE